MRRSALTCALLALLLGAAGCSTTKPATEVPKLAFAAEDPPMLRFGPDGIPVRPPSFTGGLAGRTIVVNRISDIALRRGEVVLTFDDGPMPGKTEAILNALDTAGVKATFLVVGQMARSYPALVRKVASRGHTIGTHTQNHSNLRAMSLPAAMGQIEAGIKSVSAALIPGVERVAPFFRFPYLADTVALRSHLAAQGIVVMDVDIDSKDYFQSTPDQVRQRTLQRLAQRGSGIILFHDIHQRTATMLPALLADLRAKGYSVVRLVPGRGGTPSS
jgi:peptidoglycan/xylan/chitin deacetylase (PgdA/CDA1 family)